MGRIKQSGLAMVIVIWVLSLLTIMAGSFALTMRRETTVISAVKDNAMMQAIAETGITVAQNMLFLPDESMRWRADGSIYILSYQGAEIRVRVFSEHGKIDINKADEELLTAMMSSIDIELSRQQELVSAILDWRDKDELVHTNGAEKAEYEEAGLAYQPANKDFQLIDELQMVLGMDNTIYQQLKPLITVYSKQTKVNLQVASKEVIQAIGNLDTEILDEYIQQRVENNLAQLPAAEFPLIENTPGAQEGVDKAVYTILSEAKFVAEAATG
ncbi:MAG: general secretion pathway protein GspK, partial [Methylomarinum sp.]|nr:general secretion pathway protein GspK [Methylomarinum sp.]